ncbi:GNAT family protein [Kribbella sp. NPDC051770]|uniref:GNAT family N-acetyltransferase n=1 Tax=Kribbella sp. NPDC051770 TaxID=3155413 RepID=UPI00343B35E8
MSHVISADLTTERLVLRSWTATDVAAVLDASSASQSSQLAVLRPGLRPEHWAGDFPSDGDRVIAGLLATQPEWLGAFGHRLVVERASGLVVGSIGLFWPPTDGVVELGYGVVESVRGRGYATEATAALTAYALSSPEVHTVQAGVELSNPASVRVLEKASFQRVSADQETARYERR